MKIELGTHLTTSTTIVELQRPRGVGRAGRGEIHHQKKGSFDGVMGALEAALVLGNPQRYYYPWSLKEIQKESRRVKEKDKTLALSTIATQFLPRKIFESASLLTGLSTDS